MFELYSEILCQIIEKYKCNMVYHKPERLRRFKPFLVLLLNHISIMYLALFSNYSHLTFTLYSQYTQTTLTQHSPDIHAIIHSYHDAPITLCQHFIKRYVVCC